MRVDSMPSFWATRSRSALMRSWSSISAWESETWLGSRPGRRGRVLGSRARPARRAAARDGKRRVWRLPRSTRSRMEASESPCSAASAIWRTRVLPQTLKGGVSRRWAWSSRQCQMAWRTPRPAPRRRSLRPIRQSVSVAGAKPVEPDSIWARHCCSSQSRRPVFLRSRWRMSRRAGRCQTSRAA